MTDGRLVTISNQVKQLQFFPGPPSTQKKQEPEKLAMIHIDSRLCLLKSDGWVCVCVYKREWKTYFSSKHNLVSARYYERAR